MPNSDEHPHVETEVEQEAFQAVNQLRAGHIPMNELDGDGVQEKLRGILLDGEKIRIHQQYEQGDISREATELLLGDGLAAIESEKTEIRAAIEMDTNDLCRE